jgi:hypothetical protein
MTDAVTNVLPGLLIPSPTMRRGTGPGLSGDYLVEVRDFPRGTTLRPGWAHRKPRPALSRQTQARLARLAAVMALLLATLMLAAN